MTLFKTRQVDFTQGSIMRAALQFTLPVFFANIFSSLYSIVDATVCGQFVGAEALAAVNASFALMMVLVALCAGLGVGTSVVISQLYGSRRMDEVSDAIGTALSTAMSMCLILTVFGLIFAPQLLSMLHTPADIMDLSVTYLRIVLIGFAGQLLTGMGGGLLRGLGDSSFPAFCVFLSSILNIVLDLIFVALLDWGVAGVAWATVIAHYVSGYLPIRRLLSQRYGYRISLNNFRIRGRYLKMIIRIGLFSALNQMVTSVGMMLIQSFANRFGTDFVAANGVVQKVDSFAMLPMSTIAGTISTFCAQTFGADQRDRALEGARKCTLAALAIALGIGILIFAIAPYLLLLFINRADPRFEAVQLIGTQALRVLCFFYIAYGLQQCLYCTLQGAGALRPAMMITAVSMVARVLLTWLLAVKTGNYLGLFWATSIYYVLLAALYGSYLKFGNFERFIVAKKAAKEAK